jgi:hypothetical protein
VRGIYSNGCPLSAVVVVVVCVCGFEIEVAACYIIHGKHQLSSMIREPRFEGPVTRRKIPVACPVWVFLDETKQASGFPGAKITLICDACSI